MAIDNQASNSEEQQQQGKTSRLARVLKFQNENDRVMKIGAIAITCSCTLQAILFYCCFKEIIKFGQHDATVESLQDFGARVQFAVRHQTPLLLWLVYNILAVIRVRVQKLAINPLDESTEHIVQARKNILTNSYEQLVLSMFLQLAFVGFADASLTMRLIPLINLLQFFGRIAFFIGYPLYRAFGFLLTVLPNQIMLVYNVYKYGSLMGLY